LASKLKTVDILYRLLHTHLWLLLITQINSTQSAYTGWLKKSKLLTQYNSLLFLSHPVVQQLLKDSSALPLKFTFPDVVACWFYGE